jgi:hypothetical protein
MKRTFYTPSSFCENFFSANLCESLRPLRLCVNPGTRRILTEQCSAGFFQEQVEYVGANF